MTHRKKLIEVAMPLEAINKAAAREKSIRHGHPSTLHLWWARRPLAACRAVLFGQLVDDPGSVPEEFTTVEDQDRERERLHRLIERLVPWEASTNEGVLNEARREIARSIARWRADRGETLAVDGKMRWEHPTPAEVNVYLAEYAPPIHDPFAGGGSIPLEAQRLGLRAIASDLNPVAVLINKALIEIPPRFADMEPVNPEWRSLPEAERALRTWRGAEGLAEDVRYYGRWMRNEAFKRIGHLYPKVTITEEMAIGREDLKPYVGRELTVIAWLWARTVKCPNPACGATMPLVRSFWLSKKRNRQAWVAAINEGKCVRFTVATGSGKPADGTVDRTGARCLCCNNPVSFEHIRSEGCGGRLRRQLMAIALEGDRERVYCDPLEQQRLVAESAEPAGVPDSELPERALGFRVQAYGMTHHQDLFTPRQLSSLTTFSDLLSGAKERAVSDAVSSGEGSIRANDYATACSVYLGFAIDKVAEASTTLCTWSSAPKNELVVSTFRRQSLSMTWDFAEANIFAESSGSILGPVLLVAKAIETLPAAPESVAHCHDATVLGDDTERVCVTDPPYYDNIGYADLSDFFYVWLRRGLTGGPFQSLFGTMLTPKDRELIATPHRERSNGKSPERFFEDGLESAFRLISARQAESQPISVFYAFKQTESDFESEAVASTGWETMLAGLGAAGIATQATWPVRTERSGRTRELSSNALASSILLVCRPRPANASIGTRGELVAELKHALPVAVRRLQDASIAPVDLAQSAIGPGMAVFSRYTKVLEPDGSTMTVRTALGFINQVLDEVLAAEESEYDADTRWAITWFTQHGFNEAPYGEAEVLATARNTSVNGLERAGILAARSGKVRLLRRDELSDAWDPAGDDRFTIWEACQYLIKRFEEGGEQDGAGLLRRLGSAAEPARELAYRLYQHCERKGQAEEARAYNGLVVAWPRLQAVAEKAAEPTMETDTLDFGGGES